MEIIKIFGETDVKNIEINRSCSGLFIHVDGEVTAESVSINFDLGGRKRNHHSRDESILMIAEYDAQQEGFFENTSSDARIKIPFTKDAGIIVLNDTNKGYVSLNNLDASRTYTVFAIEGLEVSKSMLSFDSEPMVNKKEHDFSLSGADEILLPISAAFRSIELFQGSANVEYVGEELKAMTMERNEVVAIVTGGVLYGCANYYMLDVDEVEKGTILTDGTAYTFVIVREQILN